MDALHMHIKRFDYYKQKNRTLEALEKIKAHYVSQAAHLAGYETMRASSLREQANLLGRAAYAMRQAANVEWWIRHGGDMKGK